MISLVSASATLVNGDAFIRRIDLCGGAAAAAVLTLRSSASVTAGADTCVVKALTGDTRTIEFADSANGLLQKTLSYIHISGTGAVATIQYQAK